MQCLHNPFISYPWINKFGGRKFKARMKESFNNTNIAEYFNPYSFRLSNATSQTVTIYIYIDRLRFNVKNIGTLSAMGMIDCYLRPGVSASGFCITKQSTTVSSWSSPFMTATYRAGSRDPELALLYNPFQSLPGNVDDCEQYSSQVSNTAKCQYDSTSVDLSIADISPRYDSTNIYYNYYWANYGYYEDPRAVYSWINNMSTSSINSLSYSIGEFVK